MKRGVERKGRGPQLGEQSISVDVDNKAKVRLKLRPNGREKVEWSEERGGTTNQSRRRFLRRLSISNGSGGQGHAHFSPAQTP